jgi:hypothetical protein
LGNKSLTFLTADKHANGAVAFCLGKIKVDFWCEAGLLHYFEDACAIGQEELVLRLHDLLPTFLKDDEDKDLPPSAIPNSSQYEVHFMLIILRRAI